MSECVICFSEAKDEVKCSNNCPTIICKECTIILIKHAFNDKVLPKCPNTNCSGVYLYSEIKKCNSAETTDKYESCCLFHLLQEKGSEASKDLEKAKIIENLRRERKVYIDTSFPPAISLVVDIAFQSKLRKLEKDKANLLVNGIKTANRRCMNLICEGFLTPELICTTCDTKFCKKCEFVERKGHVCKPEDIQSIEAIRLYVKCPKCFLRIEKASGCNNMTCASCKTKFDITNGQLSAHGSHNKEVVLKEVEKLSVHLKDRLTKEQTELLLQIEAKEPQRVSDSVVITTLKNYLKNSVSNSTNSTQSTNLDPENPKSANSTQSTNSTQTTIIQQENEIDPNYLKTTLSDEQKAAIKGALNSQISLIKGGAGTGKTTIIAELIHNLQLLNISFVVASFTGKAVARIREVTKQKKPATLHRLIAKKVDPFQFAIIDESSMVTSELFYMFGEAYKWNFRCVLIGDDEQLQPIGWGSLFAQLIVSKKIPTFSLNKNYRTDIILDDTSDVNGIMINATAIREYGRSLKEVGENSVGSYYPPFNLVSSLNFCLMEGRIENVYDIVRSLYSHGVDCDKITVITPYNRFLKELNLTVQQIYHDEAETITDSAGTLFKVGDRVMFTVNCYEYNIMNGEEGRIVDTGDDIIIVEFGDKIRHIFKTKFDKVEEIVDEENFEKVELTTKLLIHSFALTIHKSQGSEWEYVVFFMPVENNSSGFLNRNLIYTGITRARKAIWCVGDITALNSAAIRSPPYRCDNLAKRLMEG